MSRTLAFALLSGLLALIPTLQAQDRTPQAQAGPYVGVDACKACHERHVTAWADTKHARAFDRLGAADREGGQCLRCHVTGPPELIAAQGAQPSFPGVQCEACHGPGRAHVEAAQPNAVTPGAIVRRPVEQTCTGCHNPQSPHYKPFFYGAMVGLVHRVPR